MSRSHRAPGATTSRRAFIRVAGLLGLGTSLLSACGPGAPAAPTAAPAPATAAPASATAPPAAAAPTIAPAAKPLIVLDPQLAPLPALATSWETPSDATWRFKLRQGVKFHDGSPFNAEVAKYSLDRFVDPATKNPEAAVLKPITSVKAVDESTLELTTDGPFAATLTAIQNAFMMSPTAVQAAGDQIARKPVGTGQYRFVDWVPGERLVMEANPDYWGTKAKIQRLTWKPVTEASTRIVALRTGQADLIANIPPQLADQVSGPDMKLERVPGILITIMFNFAMKPFDDPKVRQALNHAVNVDEIIQFVLGGAATRLASATKPGMLGHDPDLKPYPYDPAKAKQLLAEAGFPNGFEATLDAPNGRYLNDKAVAEAIVGQLNKVGLNITLNLPDYNALVQKIVGHTSQFYLIGSVEPATEIAFPRAFKSGGAFFQGYTNDEVKDTYGLRSRLQGFEARPDPYIIVRDWSLSS